MPSGKSICDGNCWVATLGTVRSEEPAVFKLRFENVLEVDRCCFIRHTQSYLVDGDYEEDRDFRVLLHFVEVNCSIPASSKDMFLKCHKRWEKSFSDSDLKFELALGDKKFDANSFWLID